MERCAFRRLQCLLQMLPIQLTRGEKQLGAGVADVLVIEILNVMDVLLLNPAHGEIQLRQKLRPACRTIKRHPTFVIEAIFIVPRSINRRNVVEKKKQVWYTVIKKNGFQ